MIISEKQIMQLIKIAEAYCSEMSVSAKDVDIFAAKSLREFISSIIIQQSEELKVID